MGAPILLSKLPALLFLLKKDPLLSAKEALAQYAPGSTAVLGRLPEKSGKDF
jgi:hypothetical protein